MSFRFSFVLLVGVALSFLGADCGSADGCECFACTSAIVISVVDEDGQPLVNDWTAEATLDGELIDDFGSCDPNTRLTNTCSLGSTAGAYRITIRSPGFETREVVTRFAARSGDDCCLRCLPATLSNIVLKAIP